MMFISNGFVYGGEPKDNIRVENVKALHDMILLVTFNTGETRLFDASVLDGEVYKPLKNEDVFSKCTVDHGVPTWCDGDVDCAPEFINNNSYEYSQAI
jgi:hypothetical protein